MIKYLAPLLLTAAIFVPHEQPINNPTHAYHVTSVEPIVVAQFALGRGFVVGADGVARTCPYVKGVGTYIRVEKKGAPDIFQAVSGLQPLVSQKDAVFTIACLKIE